ncbi:MAG: PRD domain-containing protein [Erysipelotrichaceae bacterium]|jgi:transcriptional antiterminator/mannitol/fructose-specific phosphotransferase system IIA component (Ntr-type)|nr:PRD domain-containing protein [Erysipelotrichaceae bacterium]
MNINHKMLLIIRCLISNNETSCTLDSVLASLEMTQRVFYYHFEKINYLLKQNKEEQIQIRNGIISFSHSTKIALSQLVKQSELSFSPEVRADLITLLIGLQANVSQAMLSDKLGITRKTLSLDFTRLKEQLLIKGIEIKTSKKRGYWFFGDENTIRYCLIEAVCQLLIQMPQMVPVYFEEALQRIKPADFNYVDALRSFIHSDFGLQSIYHEESLELLSYYLIICALRKSGSSTIIHDESICQSPEYLIAQRLIAVLDNQFAIHIPQAETEYLALVMLSIKLYRFNEKNIFDSIDSLKFCSDLIDAFEVYACVRFRNREKMTQQFLLHIRPMLYRLKYFIKVQNLMFAEIREKYQSIYLQTELAVNAISERYHIQVPQDEIAYLCVFFSAWLKDAEVLERVPNILLICGSGLGVSIMLKDQIDAIFAGACNTAILERSAFTPQLINQYSGIITSIDLGITSEKIIQVHPILTRDDEALLTRWFITHIANDKDKDLAEQLAAYIEEKAPGQPHNILISEIWRIINGTQKPASATKQFVLDPGIVQIIEAGCSLYEGIRMACLPMVKQGYFSWQYYDEIIAQIEANGLYSLIGPGILLAHAKLSPSVNKMGFGFAFFQKPMKDKGELVDILIVLCTTNNEVHKEPLKDVITLIREQENMEVLREIVRQNKQGLLFQTLQIMLHSAEGGSEK